MNAKQIEFSYDAWFASYTARKISMRKLIYDALMEGGIVHETWESVSGPHHVAWALGTNNFIAPFNGDANYIADHLSSRHFGFGFEMTVAGTTYAIGNPLSA